MPRSRHLPWASVTHPHHASISPPGILRWAGVSWDTTLTRVFKACPTPPDHRLGQPAAGVERTFNRKGPRWLQGGYHPEHVAQGWGVHSSPKKTPGAIWRQQPGDIAGAGRVSPQALARHGPNTNQQADARLPCSCCALGGCYAASQWKLGRPTRPVPLPQKNGSAHTPAG